MNPRGVLIKRALDRERKGSLEALEKVGYFVHHVSVKATESKDSSQRAMWWILLNVALEVFFWLDGPMGATGEL